MDQRDLVERARQGDHDAFAALAGPAVARLDAAARLILRDPDLARDAVQDGFIRAWRNLPALRDPDKFDAWLRQLVVHSCIDMTRRRRRRPIEVELKPIDAPASGDMSSAIADREILDEALRHLDPERRAVVVLHYFLGMPLPDVANTLSTHRVKRVPVIHDGKLVGIITRTDVVRALAKLEATGPSRPGDVALQKAVLDKIRAQTWLDTAYVNVEMTNGVVRLTGFIGSDDQRRALRVLAEEMCSAGKVQDDMTVALPTVSEL